MATTHIRTRKAAPTQGTTSSLETGTAFNAGRYPVVDRHGRAFTPGCRVRFRIPTYYINWTDGAGTLQSIDQYGGLTIESDQPITRYDRNGGHVARERTVYTMMAEYAHTGPHAGRRVTTKGLGDPHEHGVTTTFVDVDDGTPPGG